MIDFSKIKVPTLLLNETIARSNLRKMAAKAAKQSIRFRPHFKTHQSAAIADWFRGFGVEAITVSSVRMAQYFARNGWKDILIAFPVNLRELADIDNLAGDIRLGLLVESVESAKHLEKFLNHQVDVWIKIDTGLHRAGIWHEDTHLIFELASYIHIANHLNFKGLLTHAGQTYDAKSPEEIVQLYKQSNIDMNQLRTKLTTFGIDKILISVGDTPGCWLSDDLGQVDEIRPGNLLFFDAMMLELGVCQPGEIAVAVACPVVAKHPREKEVIIYGGAVHLSKERIAGGQGPIFGYVAFQRKNGWRFSSKNNYVRSLSQEHGVVRLTKKDFSAAEPGDLIMVLPVHSCLAVNTLGEYLTLDGKWIETFRTHEPINR